MELCGGPLDGADYRGYGDRQNPFFILPCSSDGSEASEFDCKLFACYKLVDDDRAVFVSAKTRDQMLAMASK